METILSAPLLCTECRFIRNSDWEWETARLPHLWKAAKPNTVGTSPTKSILFLRWQRDSQLEQQVCPFRRMFKIVFKQHSIFVQRFAQKAFANPPSFYGRKMSSFTNGSSKTPIQQWYLQIRALKFANKASTLMFTDGKFSNWDTRFVHFKECSNSIPLFVQRFAQRAFATVSSFYGRPRSQNTCPKRRFWNSKWEISPSLAEVCVWPAAIICQDEVFGQ